MLITQMSSQDLDGHSVVIIVNIQLFIIRTNPGTDGVGGFNSGLCCTLQDENIHRNYLATSLRLIKFTALNISKFLFLYFNYINYHERFLII